MSRAPETSNFFTAPAARGPGEHLETLLERPGLRLERIVSFGHVTPEGDWYDQPDDEWVMLASGQARLFIEGETEERVLGPGDCLFLPAHCRHRVTWTDPDTPAIWLALHLAP
ncbi:cupin domain-containing protein [Tepidicaulis sp. LMO-SS28]|uniref:cupin domain-containing protein n=1 Tax=Tepidicaulis sp. LMO-SS28 TaxID=3447455 RepID=UPI003EDEBE45